MDKIVRRTTLAINQARRRARLSRDREARRETKAFIKARTSYNRQFIDRAKHERITRRQDWFMGPIAPRRDVGEANGAYGALDLQRAQLPPVPKKARKRYVEFAEKDRAVVIRGPEKGKIGTVREVNVETQSVQLNGINLHDIIIPEHYATAKDRRPFRTMPLSIPFSDVRLVYALRNPETRLLEDAVIDNVHCGAPFLERHPDSTLPRHTRYIAGTDVELSWPQDSLPDVEENPHVDTTRMEVGRKTFVPDIEDYPMQPSIIDELRNKYSSFRTRHDEDYLDRKREENVRMEWKKHKTLLTPLEEFRKAEVERKQQERLAKSRDAEGRLVLNKGTTSFILNALNESRLKKTPGMSKSSQ